MKKILLTFIFALGLPLIASAHPPTEVRLAFVEGKLHVEVIHTTIDHTRHYIRKITISKDKREIHAQYFHQQVDPTKFVQDFKLDVKPGDALVVEAFSSQGGSLSASITVPAEAEVAADSLSRSHPESDPNPGGQKIHDLNPYSP